MPNYITPFAMTITGFIVPMVTGLVSATSSGLILHVILRSQHKLSTSYHRIMASMSSFDIILSISVSMGTIMMPSDNVFRFAGPMWGNDISCRAQGWIIVFGYTGATAMNACLAWYFVCKIALKMDAIKIKQRVEPFMYLYTYVIALMVPSFYLYRDLLNSGPYDSFCTIAPHALSCSQSNGPGYDWSLCEWGRGDESSYYKYVVIVVYVLLAQFVLISLGISIILWTVYRNNKEIKQLIAKTERNDELPIDTTAHESDIRLLKDLRYSRVLIFQALMYIGAYILTWFLNFLSAQFHVANFELDAINCVLFPLQGLWNLIIFLYDKTYILRLNDTSITFWQAAVQVIKSPPDTPDVIFSNLSTVVIEQQPLEDVEKDSGTFSKNMPDIENSNIGSEYDDISGLQGGQSMASSSANLTGVVSPISGRLGVVAEESNQQLKRLNGIYRPGAGGGALAELRESIEE